MEAETIERTKSTRYVISRDDQQIQWDIERLTEGLKGPNDLCRFMGELAGFPLESIGEFTECLTEGPTRYIQKRTIEKTDKKSLKKLYGFDADYEKLLLMVPTGHIEKLPIAERLAERLRGISLDDYNFEGGRFQLKPEAIKAIKEKYTVWATPREKQLHTRIDALVAEIEAIEQEFGFDPLRVVEYRKSGSENLYKTFQRLVKNTDGITRACKKK